MKCAWIIEERMATRIVGRKRVSDVVPEHQCTKEAVVQYCRGEAKPGKPREILPRCKVHSPPSTREFAAKLGYTIEDLT